MDTRVSDYPAIRLGANCAATCHLGQVLAPADGGIEIDGATATISGDDLQAAGSLLDLVLPGIGSLLALVLGGAYHGYSQLRNRKVNAALVQGIETARAVLETTPQGQAADALVVKWLMENQKAAGVFATVSTLVDRVSDNPAPASPPRKSPSASSGRNSRVLWRRQRRRPLRLRQGARPGMVWPLCRRAEPRRK